MSQVNFNCEEKDLVAFKVEVGYGNVSSVLRNFIKSFSNNEDITEKKLHKELEIIEPQYTEIKTKYFRLREKLEVIEQKRKKDELNRLEALHKEKNKQQKIQGETMKTFLERVV